MTLWRLVRTVHAEEKLRAGTGSSVEGSFAAGIGPTFDVITTAVIDTTARDYTPSSLLGGYSIC